MANGTEIVEASKHVEPQYVEMMVPLYSYGCERKVKKSLSHLKGIYSVTVDYNQQKVIVWGICNKHYVLSTIRTKRKEARFWNLEDNIVNDTERQEEEETTSTTVTAPAPTSPSHSLVKPSLTKARSLSWKAWKMVFTRSHSF